MTNGQGESKKDIERGKGERTKRELWLFPSGRWVFK